MVGSERLGKDRLIKYSPNIILATAYRAAPDQPIQMKMDEVLRTYGVDANAEANRFVQHFLDYLKFNNNLPPEFNGRGDYNVHLSVSNKVVN